MDNATDTQEGKQKLIGDIRPHIDETLGLLQTPEVRRRLLKHISVADYHMYVSRLRIHHAAETRDLKAITDAMRQMKHNREACISMLTSMRELVEAKCKVSQGENDGDGQHP